MVELEWSPVAAEEEIDAYRVYVGESPTEFEISMDTEQATTVTQIDGLEPGKEYYFAVTALKGNRESEDKSDTVKATVFGIRLDIQSQANGLMLDWSNMETSIPLSSFILEYGVEPDKYTEKRILNGELRNFTVRDLLNEVTYFMKLTPVSITGEMVEDLIATTDGKPVKIAGGFRPSPAEPVPFDIISQATAKVPPPPNLHASAPETPPTGLPSFMWWLLVSVAGGAFIVQWKRKRTLQQTVAFLQTMENRYHL